MKRLDALRKHEDMKSFGHFCKREEVGVGSLASMKMREQEEFWFMKRLAPLRKRLGALHTNEEVESLEQA